MPTRKYNTRCPLCGSDCLVLLEKQTRETLISREYKLKRCGIPSGKGTLIDKTEEVQSYWLVKCLACAWSELTSGPNE